LPDAVLGLRVVRIARARLQRKLQRLLVGFLGRYLAQQSWATGELDINVFAFN
jgi:hypothetical protein